MKNYSVQLSLEVEAQNMESANTKLVEVRTAAKRKGFHISELAIRGLDSGEEKIERGGVEVSA